jgi:predicted membrane protein (TIGR00267 family)
MKKGHEPHSNGKANLLRDFILGGQDGLVNVLGIVLGVATATADQRFIIVAGLSALFAESISMGAVAFTSSKAARDYYLSELEREKREIKEMPKEERKEIYNIYYKKGFRGKLLDQVVKKITSKKKLWLDTMMTEELRMFPDQYESPMKSGFVVLGATLVGSIIPLVPFFFTAVIPAAIISVVISAIALFIGGVIKAKVTIGSWKRSGMEMAAIGMVAGIGGFIIGEILQRLFY